WNKDVAPSSELRKWYGHDPEKFDEFASRYREELATEGGRAALSDLRASVKGKRLTLVTATKDIEHSQAAVLAEILGDCTDRLRRGAHSDHGDHGGHSGHRGQQQAAGSRSR